MRQLVYNAVRCLVCGTTLVSYYAHDYKTCLCDNQTMVDGGLEYQRYGGKNLDLVERNPVYIDEPFDKVREYAFRWNIQEGDRRAVRLCEMSDDWLKALIPWIEEHQPNNRFKELYLKEIEYREAYSNMQTDTKDEGDPAKEQGREDAGSRDV